MKFKTTVCGKDSVHFGKFIVEILEKRKVKEKDWDDEFEKEHKKIKKFINQFIEDGNGGDDAVTLEFDLDKNTCVVVPRVEKVEPYETKNEPVTIKKLKEFDPEYFTNREKTITFKKACYKLATWLFDHRGKGLDKIREHFGSTVANQVFTNYENGEHDT